MPNNTKPTLIIDGYPVGGGVIYNAEDIDYDNTTSGLTADNVQSAIDEVYGKRVKSSTFSSATDANSNTSIVSGASRVVLAVMPTNSSVIATPFYYKATNNWYARVVDAAGVPVGSGVAVSGNYYYIDK